QESEQNQTSPHNILTQANINVPDEIRVHLRTNDSFKKSVCRWR
ncbi:unnamed protein product, partial [Rotaria sordida]